jgi:hypothetical protein
MKTLTREQISWNRSCGLPNHYLPYKLAFNYAEGLSSLEEYYELYSSLTREQQMLADVILEGIAQSTDYAINN